MDRRLFIRSTLGSGAMLFVAPRMLRAAAPPLAMTVYKSPSCGCCKSWVALVKGAGFEVKVVDLDDLAEIKRSAGVPADLQTCHTALVGRYVVEGHVPPDLIHQLLSEQPKITGLAVPGRPVGSPGMEQGSAKQAFAVMAFTRGGTTTVYARR